MFFILQHLAPLQGLSLNHSLQGLSLNHRKRLAQHSEFVGVMCWGRLIASTWRAAVMVTEDEEGVSGMRLTAEAETGES